MKIPVQLSALGMVCPLGSDPQTILQGLVTGSQQGMQSRNDFIPEKPVIVGVVQEVLPELGKKWQRYQCRNNQLLLAAYQQIADQVEACIKQYGKERVGLVLGTSTSGIEEGEQAARYKLAHQQFPENYHYLQQEIGGSTEFLANYLGLEGVAYTISTACSSSAKALASARQLLQAGICDVVIAGGVDTLCRLTLNGFDSLESVSDSICNPFSANRNGINIGEGAALFVVTRELGGIQLLGIGESSDAYHMSAPHPAGQGAEQAMQQALVDAELSSEAIAYINLHGTATKQNDAMEAQAVNRVCGSQTPCSSTKPLTGHGLGAAGALEIGFCWLLLTDHNQQHQLPPQVWDNCYDNDLPALALVQPGQQFTQTVSTVAKGRCNLMSNSFAFGGNNISVVIGKVVGRVGG
ncbi:beta-ketoacyl-[acyl-carrier-protein] synthase family protein [Endozoicomonas sp. SM1973]|uniref:Beta-ketoacyl-[acyl-carrier-protein] synthase family protein n=1 Tax=Spartinivicinus marinus TaxID=2994442 RepID=A0A853I724_9GAMM|nr:beta-ketoacyl-[acyl-carrier-protein] synthase family protein [Spartinivicinus marinus]MCX4025404.1 beta-ketoacyl-[acyl-carrier-protein] synthase family protein [Spartinivicinus marinus]NYZ65367.1 beta-ketoacyl-[acyl-carrier-protein] synthase family protein [Spartinivicinus marinus]